MWASWKSAPDMLVALCRRSVDADVSTVGQIVRKDNTMQKQCSQIPICKKEIPSHIKMPANA
jgi:hypothetical protein